VLESVIEAYLCRRVKQTGGEVRKLGWINRRGAPDRLALWPHAHAFFETKRPGEKPRKLQDKEIATLRAAGLTVEVLNSLDAVDALIWRMTGR
jgi:hypothetical protein